MSRRAFFTKSTKKQRYQYLFENNLFNYVNDAYKARVDLKICLYHKHDSFRVVFQATCLKT